MNVNVWRFGGSILLMLAMQALQAILAMEAIQAIEIARILALALDQDDCVAVVKPDCVGCRSYYVITQLRRAPLS